MVVVAAVFSPPLGVSVITAGVLVTAEPKKEKNIEIATQGVEAVRF